MATLALFVAATKLAGAAVALAVAANAVSFSRFRRRHLLPFVSPLHESSPVLADFSLLAPPGEDDEEGQDGKFFFGLATAPAHAEDRLDDAWLHFACEEPKPSPKEAGPAPQPADALMASATGGGGSHPAPRSRAGDGKGEAVKPLKVAMEAMIRGFEKLAEEGNDQPATGSPHNVAAWHNVPRP